MYVLYQGYPTTTTPGYPTTPSLPPSDYILPVTTPLSAPPTVTIPTVQPQLTLTPQQQISVCRKRGSDELMSQSPMVTNGTVGMSPQHNHEMNNDAKKAKLDQNQVSPPSKVVHIRSLPSDVTESEVVQLGLPFGRLTNMLLLKQKNQAFLEFGDEQAASTMISYYQSTPAQIRSKSIFVQYSNHKELKTDASHSFQNATAQAALQAAQAVMLGSSPDDQKTILHVIVEQVLFPVSIDTLHQIFCKFGKILKAIIFTKNGTFQALIQFGDAVAARTAKLSLDGQNIYNGCCTLRIDYSKLNNLNVKYNNDKSRDFTNPNLPVGDPSIDGQMHMGAMSSMGGIPGAIPSPFPMPGLGAQPLTTYSAAGAPGFGGLAAMPVPGFGLPAASPMANSRMGAGMGMTMGMGMGMGMPMTAPIGSSVILVSNLDEQKVTPDALFTLFGVYGDVHRVKILYQKKDNALIQMAEPHQAQLALAHLDKVKVWGKPIRVAQSKHSLVQMPKEGQPDAGLTKDFTNSPLHRFKRPGSKNCQNIFPPSAVLHLSNIPPSVSEDVITDLFSDYGNVTGFKFFQKDRKMALIQMETDEEAIHALIGLHNYQLSDSQHLRVSFSKSTLQ